MTQPLGTSGGYTQAPLTDFQTTAGISGILGPALNPFLAKLTLIRGLDFLPSVNHNYGGLLGNFSSCTAATPCDADSLPDVPTIDQVLAYSPKFYAGTPAAALPAHLAGRHRFDVVFRPRHRGRADAAAEDAHQPAGRLQRLCSAACRQHAPAAPAPRSRQAAGRSRSTRTTPRLRQSARLSAGDKQLVDQYVNLVAELQAKMMPTAADDACTRRRRRRRWRTTPARSDGHQHQVEPVPGRGDAAAIMCDQTRIITIGVHKALGPGPDSDQHHAGRPLPLRGRERRHLARLAHDFANANSRRMLKGINEWIASEIFAKLLAKLDVPESGRQDLPRQLAGLLGQRARLQSHRLQRPLPAGRQRRRLHQARPLPRLHRLERARLLLARRRQRHQRHPAQPLPGDPAAGDGPRARRLRARRQARLRLDQHHRPRPRRLGRRLRPDERRPDPARDSGLGTGSQRSHRLGPRPWVVSGERPRASSGSATGRSRRRSR